MTKHVLDSIINEAFSAARSAEQEFRAEHGEPWFCGFAWVNIKPGNCAIANALKKRGDASASYYGGVDVWNPGGSNTQSMSIKEAGADAFAAVLNKYGFKAYSMSRAD